MLEIGDLPQILFRKPTIFLQNLQIFLEEARSEKGKKPTFVTACSTSAPLSKIIKMMAKHKVNSVWIVNSHHNPVGIIGVADVCKKLYFEEEDDHRRKRRIEAFKEERKRLKDILKEDVKESQRAHGKETENEDKVGEEEEKEEAFEDEERTRKAQLSINKLLES